MSLFHVQNEINETKYNSVLMDRQLVSYCTFANGTPLWQASRASLRSMNLIVKPIIQQKYPY